MVWIKYPLTGNFHIDEPKVRTAVEDRDKASNVRIESIKSKILRRKNNAKNFQMIVRIGFDFELKVEDDQKKEDIIVDILFRHDKTNSAETFEVKNVVFVPEIWFK